jgi:hypothetical protein
MPHPPTGAPDPTVLAVEFQRTGNPRALEALLRWAAPRITARVREVASRTGATEEDLTSAGSGALYFAVKHFSGRRAAASHGTSMHTSDGPFSGTRLGIIGSEVRRHTRS